MGVCRPRGALRWPALAVFRAYSCGGPRVAGVRERIGVLGFALLWREHSGVPYPKGTL